MSSYASNMFRECIANNLWPWNPWDTRLVLHRSKYTSYSTLIITQTWRLTQNKQVRDKNLAKGLANILADLLANGKEPIQRSLYCRAILGVGERTLDPYLPARIQVCSTSIHGIQKVPGGWLALSQETGWRCTSALLNVWDCIIAIAISSNISWTLQSFWYTNCCAVVLSRCSSAALDTVGLLTLPNLLTGRHRTREDAAETTSRCAGGPSLISDVESGIWSQLIVKCSRLYYECVWKHEIS